MGGSQVKKKGGLKRKSKSEAAKGRERIAEMGRAHRRLAFLYNITKLIARFESIERTVPKVVAVLGRTLSFCTAVLIMKTAPTGEPQTIVWKRPGTSTEQLRVATSNALLAYCYLVRPARGVHGQETMTLNPPPALREQAASKGRFVTLPLVVDHGAIFGTLQLECSAPLDELDLVFINAAVNQLAIGLDRHGANRALRTSEAKLAGIVSLAFDAIISIDDAQRLTLYNEGAERIFGWSREEVMGKPIDLLVPERLREAHRQHIRNFATEPVVARRLGIHPGGFCGLRKDGDEFPAEAAISKLNVDGTWLFTIMVRDVTEQRRAEKEEKFLTEIGVVIAATLDFQETLNRIAELVLRELADLCMLEFVDERGRCSGSTWRAPILPSPTLPSL